MKLVMTITPKGVKYVPCCALGMDTHYRRSSVKVSKSQCQRGFHFLCVPIGIKTFEGKKSERGPVSWKNYFCDLS